MKVLLVNPPYRESIYLHAPLGLCYVASVLMRDGHDVRITDLAAEEMSIGEYKKLLRSWSPAVVGITSMTPHISSAAEIAKATRKALPKCMIILGGSHITVLPEQTMDELPEIDAGVLGEAEETVSELLKLKEARKSWDRVKGTITRAGRSLRNNGRRGRIENLDKLPFPARFLLMGKYHKSLGKTPYATVMTSRGCPYSCLFCAKEIFGRSYRPRSIENVMDEIKMLKEKYKVREIIFFDDSFTLKRDRIMELCEEFIKLNLDIQWKCETRVNIVDAELLRKMKEAGCYLVAYGIESGVQKNINFLNKGVTIEQTRRAVRETKDAGLLVQGYLIIGIPGETREEIKETMNFAISIGLDFIQLSILTPLPGTDLYRYAKKNGSIKDGSWSHYSYFGESSRSVMELSNIPVSELETLRSRAIKKFYLRPGYLLKGFMKMMRYNDMVTLLSSLKILAG